MMPAGIHPDATVVSQNVPAAARASTVALKVSSDSVPRPKII
jgi:hypothetical protein